MAGIPTVPGSEIDVNTPASASPVSPGAFQNEGGRRAIAGAFDQVSSEAQGVEHDLIRAHEAGVAAAVDLTMRTARQSFLDSLRNDSDEGWRSPTDSAWKERAKELSSHVRDEIFSQHTGVTPEMKREMESSFNAWQGSLMTEAQISANVQMTNRAWGRKQQDYNEALKDDDAKQAMNLMASARKNNLADPALVDQMERDIPRVVAGNYITRGLTTNPAGTLDILRSGASLPADDQYGKPIVPSKVFPPKELEQLINTARIRTEAWQRGNAENMLKSDVNPVTGFVPDETIKAKMASKDITEKFGMGLMKSQDAALKAKTHEEAVALHKADEEKFNLVGAMTHDPHAWGSEPDAYAHSLAQEASKISDPALRQKAITDINRQVDSVKKTGATAEGPVEKQMYEQMNQDLESQGVMIPVSVEDVAGTPAEKHWFGADVPEGKGTTRYTHMTGGLSALKAAKEVGGDEPWPLPGMTKEQAIASATEHNARLQSQMRDWFKTEEGQKATFEQANEHRKAIERPYVMDAVRNSLARRAPVMISTAEEMDALPSGARFTDTKGQTWTKP